MSAHPYLRGAAAPKIFAHRGFVSADAARAGIVENSASAFSAALEAGADYLESDCRLTADGDVVLFHDASLQRVLGIDQPVIRTRTAELRAMLSDRGELLTMSEAFDAFPAARFNIDVKSDAVAESAGIAAAPHADRVLLASFDERRRNRALAAARIAGADIATSASRSLILKLVASLRLGLHRRAARLIRTVDALQIPARQSGITILTAQLTRLARAQGVDVHVWTVNDAEQMRAVVATGADGIVTDRVDVARRVFPQKSSR